MVNQWAEYFLYIFRLIYCLYFRDSYSTKKSKKSFCPKYSIILLNAL